MKKLFLFFVLMPFLLTGCPDDEVRPAAPRGSWNPVRCGEGNCNTEWNFSFQRIGFPTNVAIFVSDVEVLNECNPDGSWTTQTNGSKIEFKRDNFANIKKGEKIDLRVMDLGDPCNSSNQLQILRRGLGVEVSEDENDRYVMVEAI